ncbi:glycerophosphodiester phosphodiesterase family protein [Salinisphaera orenii]|uniref:glycerophosphodiester phosphodiesterase family protein n=1 Tax=Salinisphaera orenii TaxID=856731 RepID=UPI0013A65615
MQTNPAQAVIAHRGGSGLRLENTLAAFDNAIAAGCDGAELDVHLTADNALVVHHNAQLNHRYTKAPDGQWLTRDTQPKIADLTLAEVQHYRLGPPNPDTDYAASFPDLVVDYEQWIPTLAEVIDRVQTLSNSFQLVIEIKSSCLLDPHGRDWQPQVEAIAATVQQYAFAHRAILCGFDWRSLRYARTLLPTAALWMNTHPFDWLRADAASASDLPIGKSFLEALRVSYAAGAPWYDGLQPHCADDAGRAVKDAGGDCWFGYYSDCTDSAIDSARRVNVDVGAWTVNLRDPDKRAALRSRALDAVCVDYF